MLAMGSKMDDRKQGLLADLVWPTEAYTRATNIELDYRNPEGVPEYKFTSKALRLLEDVLDSCQGNRRDRAWSVVGPYGSGKSTFSLFLLQVLTGSSSAWLRRCLVQLRLASPAMEQRVKVEILTPRARYLPVIVQGARLPLDLALCRALHRAITDDEWDTSWVPESLRSSLQLTLETLETGVSDSRSTLDLYSRASKLAKEEGGFKGLLVVVDEFGKFLERAAWQGDLPDLMAAQYLAELASAQREPDVLFLVLLHQGFQHYASSLSQKQWVEWAKIQGRFRQVDFNEEPDNLYSLVAASMKERGRSQDSVALIKRWSQRVWEEVKHIPAFKEHQESLWPDLLSQVYPLHPIALYALPRLSARLGQNERTLFSFLASDDALGLKKFLRSTPLAGEELPSLTLDYLFEYFLTGARYASLPPDVQRRISEIDAALDRLGDRPPLEVQLLKVLAAISVLRGGPSLPASEGVLAAALDINSEGRLSELRDALEGLLTRKIVVFRKFSGEYRIWQGSDFDFDTALSKAREEVQADFELSTVLDQELVPRPLVARKHSFETGTTRFFAVQFIPAAQAVETSRESLSRKIEKSHADGLVLYVLPRNCRELGEAEQWAKSLDESRLLVVLPREPIGVTTIVQDLAALRRIRSEWPELQDDPVAMKELAARIESVDDLLHEAIDTITEPAPRSTTCYWKGQAQHVADRRQLNRLLSQICDDVYTFAPRIRNELINRRGLSTAVVVAVKKIISGLIAQKGEPMLGFSGNGPEVSIFRAVFELQDIYRGTELGNYSLSCPTERTDHGLRHVWEEIEDFLHSTTGAGRPITDLYTRLTEPPYGLREGLLPILTWAVLLYHRQSACLYENGTYVKDWSAEMFDRFVKAPVTFTVRWLILAGPMGALVRELNLAVPNATALHEVKGAVPLTGFLENLYRWYHGLPDFGKHTQRLPSGALELRKVINTAVDPIELIMEKVPQALGLSPTTSGGSFTKRRRAQYAQVFKEAILDLTSAYSGLINDLVERTAADFGTRPVIVELRGFFQRLDPLLLEHVRDVTAKAFLVRARDEQPTDVHWVESLGAVLANQAPRFWMDHHREEFEDKLSLVALALRDAQRRAFARRLGRGMRRIILECAEAPVVDVVVEEGNLNSETSGLAAHLLSFLDNYTSGISKAQKQAILARALELTVRESLQGGADHEHR